MSVVGMLSMRVHKILPKEQWFRVPGSVKVIKMCIRDRNVGKMGNRGFELLVEGDVFQQKEFSWTLSANLGLNKRCV